MAYLKQAKTEDEIKSLGVANVRKAYNELATDYNKIINYEWVFCHKCGDHLASPTFYSDLRFTSGLFPICKRCLLQMVEQRVKKTDEPNETKQSVQSVLQMMDLPYLDDLYEDCIKGAKDAVKEKNRRSPFSAYITCIKSLPQYKDKHWSNSEFGSCATEEDEIRVNNKTLKNAKKRFGSGYSQEDYMFLESEYQDWITRYECNTKAQEEIFKNLSMNRFERKQAVKSGKPTKEIDKTFQELLAAQNIQPRQSSTDATSEGQTFGTLIQKFEETRPLPDIDPELEDVDKIGYYIDVFFRGHASKMLSLKNAFSHLYERHMKKYTVTPPSYDEDSDSEAIFEQIFGSREEE